MNVPAPVLAALIAAFVALLGVAINFLSSLLAIWNSQNVKVRDWLFEKRFSYSEELIVSLSGMATDFEKLYAEARQIYATSRGTIEDTHGLVQGVTLGYLTEEFVVNKKKRLYERALDFDNGMGAKSKAINDFVEFELPRLTAWFDEDDRTNELVTDLCRRYLDLMAQHFEAVVTIKQWARDKAIMFDETFIEESRAIIYPAINLGEKAGRVVVSESVKIQKDLARRYIDSSITLAEFVKRSIFKRGSTTAKDTAPNQYGLLVRTAIRLECWLKRFRSD